MTRIPAVLCLIASAAAPQSAPAEPGREKLLGQTLGPEGRPWPGATVRLLFRPVLEREDFGTADMVEVRSDEAGQFKAALLPCRAYSAYACEPREDGGMWFSGVQEGVLASAHLVLRKEASPRLPRTVQIDGIAAWTKIGQSVSVRAVAATFCRQVTPVALDEKGQGTVPPHPGGTITLELVGSGGLPILERRLTDRDVVAPEPLRLPPPVRVRATVRGEGEEGAPIPGATVWVVAAAARRSAPVGTTDAAGRCELWLPGTLESEPIGALLGDRELQADAPGFAITSVRVSEIPAADGWLAKEALREVTLVARQGYSASGRVLGADQQPVAGATLLLSCAGSIRLTENSRRGFQVWPRAITTGADGSFTLPSLDPDCPFQLMTETRGLRLEGSPAGGKSGTFPPTPLAVLARGSGPAGKPLALGDLGPGAAAPVLIEVRTADGPPARNAQLEWLMASRSFDPGPMPTVYTDQRGRAALLLPAGKVTLLASSGVGQVRFETVEPGPAPGAPHVITLEPALSMRGKVVDPDGKPVAGATVWVRQTQSRGGGGMTAEERSARMMYNRRSLRGESDEQGRFQLWFLPVPGTTWGVTANAKGSGITSPVVQVEQESLSDVELVVPVPDKEGEAAGGAQKGGAVVGPGGAEGRK